MTIRQTVAARTRTGAIDLRVIDCHYRHKGRCVVAGFANIRRINMSWPFTRRRRTVMTTETIIKNAGMAEDNTD